MNEYDDWFDRAEAEIERIVETVLPASVNEPIELPEEHEAGIRGVIVSDVEAEQVDWLWFPYIPLGKLTILEGDPGVGKSWITAAIAAAVSSGTQLPESTPIEPSRVMLFSAEDGIGDTIRPRLDSLEGRVEDIWAADEAVTFDEAGLRKLEVEVAKQKPRLVVVDPLVAYLGGKVDFHRANEVRAVLAPFAKIAETYRCAILAVRHLSKSQSKSIYRGQGSIDITAAARSVLLAGVLPTNPDLRAMVQVKSNLAPMGAAVGFSLGADGFQWVSGSDIDAEDILGTAADRSQLEAAIAWLVDYLKVEPLPSTSILQAAREARIAESTLRRAKDRAHIKAMKQPGVEHGDWFWLLPGQSLDEPRAITNVFDF